MSSQASLSRSSAAATGPLSPRAASSVGASVRGHRRRSLRNLAVVAATATTLALSSAATPAAAFVTSPLHGAAPGRVTPPVGTNSDCVGGPCGCSDDITSRSQRGPMCPPLVMVLTDPETLLRDADMEARMWRRSRAVGPSSATTASGEASADDATARNIIADGSSYLAGLSKLRREMSDDFTSASASSAFPSTLGGGDTGRIQIVKPTMMQKKKKRGRKATTAPVRADGATVTTSHEPQNIEAEIEVVAQELFDVELKLERPAIVQATTAAVKPTDTGAAKAPQTRAKAPRKRATAAAAAARKAKAKAASSTPLSTVAPKARPSAATVAETAVKIAASDATKAAESKATSAALTAARAAARNTPSRSSTMPGFASRKETARRRSHREGIAIVERRTGKTIRNAHGVGDAESKKTRKKANSEAMYKGSASVPDSLIAFTNEIHEECDRITPTEEIELGTLTQEAIRIQTLHDDLETSLGREPTDDEWCAAAGKINAEALRQAIDEGMSAKDQLVTSNLRMVQGVVNLYIRNGLGSQYNAGDLMQEGILALIRAAEKFDPSRGFRFSTYAMYGIRAGVKRSQVLQSRILQVPQRLHETHKRILKVEKELRQELGRPPTKPELAAASDLSEVQLQRCLKAMAQECHSLDATIQNTLNPNKNDNRRKDTMYDLVDSKQEDDGRRELLRRFSRESLVDTLRRYLNPHEVDLLLLRYGLMDERTLPHGFSGPLTIAEVSRLVGLKPDKVRRMINGCLRQLRPLIAHEWQNYENELP